jgi:hypothetical protein
VPPLTLRAHHLLCLQGFRGLGYSPAFVEQMAALRRRLFARQETRVALTNQPDVICRACPHLDPEGACRSGAPERRDDAVLKILGVGEGAASAWGTWLDRVAASLDEQAFEQICAGCRWLDLGYCRQAIEALRRAGKGDRP